MRGTAWRADRRGRLEETNTERQRQAELLGLIGQMGFTPRSQVSSSPRQQLGYNSLRDSTLTKTHSDRVKGAAQFGPRGMSSIPSPPRRSFDADVGSPRRQPLHPPRRAPRLVIDEEQERSYETQPPAMRVNAQGKERRTSMYIFDFDDSFALSRYSTHLPSLRAAAYPCRC